MTDTLPGPADGGARRAFREALAARRARVVRASQGFATAVIGIVAAGVLLKLDASLWVPAVGFVAVAGLVLRLANWKCPDCGERLPTRGGLRCRGCGASLEE